MKHLWLCTGVLIAFTSTAQTATDSGEFMKAMVTSMTKMDRDMATAPMTGDVDHDFASMMIPHHAGAIDMAKAELSRGRDPVMRRMAQEILAEQQSEIDAMNLWLRKKQRLQEKRVE